MRTWYVLLDLDGVVCRWPHQRVVDRRAKAALLLWLAAQAERGVTFTFIPVTNRPAGHLQYACYDWQVKDGVCIAESGATAYQPAWHTELINPEFEQFCRRVRPGLVATLTQELCLGPGRWCQEDPGGRKVTIEIVARDRRNLPQLAGRISSLLSPFGGKLRLEVGKSVVIFPLSCNKAVGLSWLQTLFASYFGRSFPWRRSVWVADGERDVSAAELVAGRGGLVAAVGGSQERYRIAVERLGGMVAGAPYEAGLLEILRQVAVQ